ncbi:4-hydroxythreonine-4-phosphate dehydrogenase PdxA [Cochlodiniinecator piscidefendens]|uniref:4-hydroxythreonine-4-phosphate dehydrogenase PdxA n=1 Tax=Cochlodiniinecator piscidefendens TaxID=2715756 RepID=UPI00140B0B5A|nr:4-hydroxythreonine-4-phosphate dehydrogenase PdxA [Cochlodiniinecator piscidefendens]
MTIAPIALTCGEPAGIGPELTVKAWEALKERLPFFLIGDPRHLPPGTPIAPITHPSEAASVIKNAMPVLVHEFAHPAIPGTPTLENAQGVIDVIAKAVSLTQSGEASAVCTNPIHKKVLKDGANFAYPGHTEYLASLGGVDHVVMMLASPLLRVVPATIHIALSEVPRQLTPELLEQIIRITHAALERDFDIKNPRLAIAGLNPHAGEGGTMGREELQFMTPLISRLNESGVNLAGPMSADTMFHARARETYDAAICMYHDQALIPIKTLDFDRGVNVTLGLPFVRTSPDHGTGFDIAGQGVANPTSLIEAMILADTMARARSS